MSAAQPPPRRIRIHGDNIVECERTLRMLTEALEAGSLLVPGRVFAPTYRLSSARGSFLVQLLPGYGRWGVDLAAALRESGAPLSEAADALVTEVSPDGGGRESEQPLIAIEFCGALPAGNNAWQRCGRSYSYAIAGIPYLYVSELGGYELGADRVRSAPRYPNPLVPFAYVTQSDLSDTFALPVYEPSPSISAAARAEFEPLFGHSAAVALVRAVLTGGDHRPAAAALLAAGLDATIAIAGRRARGGLPAATWRHLAGVRGVERLRELSRLGQAWRKRITIPTTPTLAQLTTELSRLAVGAGSSDMPFGIVPADRRKLLAARLRACYDEPSVGDALARWLAIDDTPLVVTLVAGFKPGGEDSRPDRGLLPLVRMLFGEECQVLSVVYGPAAPSMWETYGANPARLEGSNGLWQSLLRLSDAVLVDSPTAPRTSLRILDRSGRATGRAVDKLPAASTRPQFGEHDVDTVVTMLGGGDAGIFEGLCNPPGGDWSGISLLSTNRACEYRWTSLPRVTGVAGKRPDHVLQLLRAGRPDVVLSIESKDSPRSFEAGIGHRLVTYVEDLLRLPPTIVRPHPDGAWHHNDDPAAVGATVLSAGAFVHQGAPAEAVAVARTHGFDVALAVSFADPDRVRVLVAHRLVAASVAHDFARSAARLDPWVEVQVHGFDDVVE